MSTVTKDRGLAEHHLKRVRHMCMALPKVTEKLSHGAPTFFVHKKVFVIFADNHHDDGNLAVWLPVPIGMQEDLIEAEPDIFFRPPYVGHRGWVGIGLAHISDEELTSFIREAWTLIAPKRLLKTQGSDHAEV